MRNEYGYNENNLFGPLMIPTFKTPRLSLRPLHLSDLDDFFLLRSDQSASNFVDMVADTDKDQSFKAMIKTLQDIDAGKYQKWAIDLEGTLIGTIALWNYDPLNSSAEFGYSLRSPYRGNGYMSESLACLIKYGHQDLGIRDLFVYTEASNERSNKLLPKLGFVYQTTVDEQGQHQNRLFHYHVHLHQAEK